MKIAIVTGGTRGIGRDTAIILSQRGYKVYALYHKNKRAAEILSEQFPEIITMRMDVSNKKEVEKVISEITNEQKSISVLVNNAGIVMDQSFLFMSERNWSSVLNTNISGIFNVTKVVSKHMLDTPNAAILNVSSIASKLCSAGQCNYSASKAGIEAFSKVLAKELSIFGVRVNTVSPGYIETSMIENLKEKEQLKSCIPLKRFGKSQEVAELIYFLISEKSGYITGQNFIIDGGLSC